MIGQKLRPRIPTDKKFNLTGTNPIVNPIVLTAQFSIISVSVKVKTLFKKDKQRPKFISKLRYVNPGRWN